MKRQEIVDEARRLLSGKPKWRLMGRTEKAMDCYGLIILVRKKFGLASEDDFRYGHYPKKDFSLPIARRLFTQVNPPIKPGQVIAFHYEQHPWHFGISAIDQYGRTTIIHSSAGTKKVTEDPFDIYLQQRFRGCFDFPGVED